MIPKIIHYCWFGGNPLPELAQKCIDGWKRFCPDYEIKRWDESNFAINCCDYVREAYEAKKWAFVSDYARYKILYDNGGLYFDTDVELIKPIDDIVERGSFLGCEILSGVGAAINPGLGMGAENGLAVYQEILEHYEQAHFLQPDGIFDLTTVVDRTTAIFEKHGFVPTGSLQHVADVTVYPPKYFSPMDMGTGIVIVKKETRSIHHYDGSWAEETVRERNRLRWKYSRIFGAKIGGHLYKIPYAFYILRHDGFGAFWEKVKKKFKREK